MYIAESDTTKEGKYVQPELYITKRFGAESDQTLSTENKGDIKTKNQYVNTENGYDPNIF